MLWPVYPWDFGTRNPGETQVKALVDLVKEIDADGINGDTLDGVNITWWQVHKGPSAALQ